MKNLINIDQLHKNIELINIGGTHLHRNQRGITTAYMYLILGEVWLGNEGNAYLYVGESRSQTEQMCRDVKELITQHIDKPLVVRTSVNMLNVNNQFYLFTSARSINDQLHGQSYHRVFLDVSPETRENVLKAEGMQALHFALIEGGDIL